MTVKIKVGNQEEQKIETAPITLVFPDPSIAQAINYKWHAALSVEETTKHARKIKAEDIHLETKQFRNF